MSDIYDEKYLIELFYVLSSSYDSRNHFVRAWFAHTHFLSVFRFSKNVVTFEGLRHIRYHVSFELCFTKTILLHYDCDLFGDLEPNWVIEFILVLHLCCFSDFSL